MKCLVNWVPLRDSVPHRDRRINRTILKLARKDGKNMILLWMSSVATFRVRTIDKLDEACINADDRMMLARHRSSDRVMS